MKQTKQSEGLQGWPSTQEMYNQLQSSGILDETTPVPKEYLATYLKTDAEKAAELGLAHSGETGFGADFEAKYSYILKWAPRVLGVLLTLQSLRGIWKSIAFIFIEFPALEQTIIEHTATELDVRIVVGKAVLIMISTVISAIFGMKLALTQNKAARILSTTIGIVLMFVNAGLPIIFEYQEQGISIAPSLPLILDILRNIL